MENVFRFFHHRKNQMKFETISSLIACFFVLTSANAQLSPKEFLPGYIIKTNGERVEGQIGIVGPKVRCQQVFFKKHEQSEIQTFTPDEIKSYYSQQGTYKTNKIVYFRREEEITFFFKKSD